MAILGERGLSGVVKLMLDLVFIGGIGIFISLPLSLKWYVNTMYQISEKNYWFLLVFLYVTGFFCLLIVNEMRKIFKNLNRRNPFIMDNVRSLKRIAAASFVISAAYTVKILVYNSFFTIILAMVFIIAGLFSLILGEVFNQAVIVKEENDLTI